MPRTHGSALFTRGQTQALTLCTLGTAKEEQRIDDLSLDETKRYIHHYNFPPFRSARPASCAAPSGATSVTARWPSGRSSRSSRAQATSRTRMRVVSEILESNGSSSMASVCGIDPLADGRRRPDQGPRGRDRDGADQGGRRLRHPTDIQGAEDHLGDMDFKVAGTEQGVTALQMDIKITGVTTEILREMR